jgi:hypothetical protein
MSELASLYFNVDDELTAVAYLLGINKGGADCLLADEEIYIHKPQEQYAKPYVKLMNAEDAINMKAVVCTLPKRDLSSLQSSPMKEQIEKINRKKKKRTD